MPDRPAPSSSQKILVVDDIPSNLLMLTRFLKGKGYEVITASDGEEALEKVRQHNPKVVLLDIYMPRKGGMEVLREIRRDHPHVGVIMVTVVDDEAVGREALATGAFDYIIKPFDLHYLENVLWWKLQTME